MTAVGTYDRILQVAQRLFVRQGYTATSMRQIAEEAGIGKATIYHHFSDKRSMVMALLEKNAASMDKNMQLVRAEADPRRRIQVATETSMRFLFKSVDLMTIVRREVPGGRDQMQTAFMTFFREYMAQLTDAIRRGTKQGLFRPVDPADSARVLMTMIQGTFAMTYLDGGRGASPEQVTAALLDIYFQGIDRR